MGGSAEAEEYSKRYLILEPCKEKARKLGAQPNPMGGWQEKAKWADFPEVKGLIKAWIDQQNAAGRPGTEVMRTFLDNFGISKWMPPGY